ncbi:MAG: addiction module protein [Bacteroidetes bacterium]|nr:addiction module protein [Bacteroidota bacterium]
MQLKEILSLTREEKIALVQTLWDDISSDQSNSSIPEEHKILLEQTLQRIAEGKSQFLQWNEVKEKYGKGKG